jgi:hypothetical protein
LAGSEVCIVHGSSAFYIPAKFRQVKKMNNFEVILWGFQSPEVRKRKKKEKWSDHYYIYFQ